MSKVGTGAAQLQLTAVSFHLPGCMIFRAGAGKRAGFACAFVPENAAICPKIFDREPIGYADENYAHAGADVPAGASGFDWGIGSALTTAARMLELFGDLWIDVHEGWALGIDGIIVTDCRCEGDTWHVDIRLPFKHTDTITIKGNSDDESVTLVVNGRPVGAVSDKQLQQGTVVRLADGVPP